MRKGYFYSLVFALLSSASIAAIAAPQTTDEAAQSSVSAQTATEMQTGKFNLNTADVLTLQRELAGVGEAKAKAIINYRESNGSFASVDELLEVKGIGKAILERNRDKLEVN
ncbi:competence protein ComEA [Pseudomonas sp. 43NM1]|uniref:ComEA family DNA-binding protein n=1 Tax=Pseudomonas sp. 43NM1 TaxID=1904755 RepID=UPI000C31C4B3|nr:helix-hairpin-helix domain-containing protein [Pseudomonas sp. 43NM1]PKH16627.1 competence protein ComEA [Pseudomonas sp. 43NM1]